MVQVQESFLQQRKVSCKMTRAGRRLVEDFLLPSLNDQRYGDRLKWINKDTLKFSIRWNHKNASKWSLDDTVVFQDWDKLKGHYHPDIKGYHMQAKQRFRAALYKLSTVRKLHNKDKQIKIYQLVPENDKRKNVDYNTSILEHSRPSFPTGIPTSVIQWHIKRSSSPVDIIKKMDVNEEDSSGWSSDVSTCSEKTSGVVTVMPKEEEIKRRENQQRHVPVQLLPSYRPSKPSNLLHQEWEYSQKSSQQFTKLEDEALNLSTKNQHYQNSSIPVAAR